jgi:hypothetical protein
MTSVMLSALVITATRAGIGRSPWTRVEIEEQYQRRAADRENTFRDDFTHTASLCQLTAGCIVVLNGSRQLPRIVMKEGTWLHLSPLQ